MKFGILGCGHIASKMAFAVKTLEKQGYGIETFAVASRTLDKAEKFAADYGFAKAYGSYEELATRRMPNAGWTENFSSYGFSMTTWPPCLSSRRRFR